MSRYLDENQMLRSGSKHPRDDDDDDQGENSYEGSEDDNDDDLVEYNYAAKRKAVQCKL